MTIIALTGPASARQALLENGRSPDNRFGAYLVSPDEPDSAAGDFPSLVVRGEQDHRTMGSFVCGSYMAYFDPAYERTKVAWSADSQFFAMISQGTKTTFEATIYHVTGDGVSPVSLPEYSRALFKRLGITTSGRYFLLSQPAWRDHNLRLHVSGNISDSASNPKDFSDDWYECTIVFRIRSATKASIEKIIVLKSPKRPIQTMKLTATAVRLG
jgi:hypothetical protein